MISTETICALSTAPGRAGIAVVRISGSLSFNLLQRLFVPDNETFPLAARFAALGRLVDPHDGHELDQALATCFPSPHSYTGENVVELSLHGSPVVVAAVLDRLCASGARLAEPGEFTMRAFLNGRMDLAQAEAVRDVIEAVTSYQARVAARQRAGDLSRQLGPVKKLLIDIIVNLESAVEFVEEDLTVETRATLAARLQEVRSELRRWADSYRQGRIVRDGFNLAIVGRPNAGKSSLFNALLARERSIVTEVAGTTRDVVSEFASLEGIPVRLADTAGIRQADNRIEELGIDRSFQAMADADAVLLVTDLGRPRSPEDEHLKARLTHLNWIAVMNKCDLPCCWTDRDKGEFAQGRASVEVSAKYGRNIPELRSSILQHVLGNPQVESEGILVTNLRHCRCLESTEESLARAAESLRAGMSEEFPLVDLHAALRKLGEITGETTVDNLLGEIFSRFCVGK